MLYFAYGSNMNKADMLMRCPDSKAIGPYVLKDWKLVFRGVADIVPAPDEQVMGALWEITSSCLFQLDRYESYPVLYRRHTLEIDGYEENAVTYLMNSDKLYSPSDYYLETIAKGYSDFGFDPDIVRNIATLTDR